SSFDLLSGVYFPLTVLPVSLRFFSLALPTTPALGLWRTIVLEGKAPLLSDVAIQCAWAVVLLAAGIASFHRAVRLVRIKGELGTY
ncbi:MAG: ABC transporter permease, partial [Endomicrobiales bacterium]